MFNVSIKLVQYDSLKRFGVPNLIIYIFVIIISYSLLREIAINLCVFTQITHHLLHKAYIH